MNRKREKPYNFSRHAPYSFSKRRRPSSLDAQEEAPPETPAAAPGKQPSTVVVLGLPSECSILDLKSRFEIYGSISRTRIDPNGLAYVTFRSNESAQSAITAALDHSFPITVNSVQVQVMWASDPIPQWREGVARKDGTAAVSSKLMRAEVPLSRHGRGNKLGSAIVNPKDDKVNGNGIKKDSEGDAHSDKTDGNDIKKNGEGDALSGRVGNPLDAPYKGREIVAYDDIF